MTTETQIFNSKCNSSSENSKHTLANTAIAINTATNFSPYDHNYFDQIKLRTFRIFYTILARYGSKEI